MLSKQESNFSNKKIFIKPASGELQQEAKIG
jgi:hypothetical protein